MDASTTAAAALAIAVAASEQSAMEALLLERERLAMIVEDQASFLAQRHWVGTLHLQRLSRPMTWRELYDLRHSDLERAWAAMRVALRAHGCRQPARARRPPTFLAAAGWPGAVQKGATNRETWLRLLKEI